METKRLGDICDIVSGGTPSRSKVEFWNNGTIPGIKISNIKGKYVDEADEFITQAGLDGSSAKMLSKGTILYTIFATLGETGILTIDACTNQAIAGLTIRNNNQISIDYLYYYLRSKKAYVNNIGRGVAQNNINLSILKNFELPIPDLPIQKRIVGILNITDNIISERKKQLQQFDDLIKARFVEMFGDPVHNSKNLHLHPMTNVCEIIDGDRGKNYPKQEDFFEQEFCLFLNAKNVTKHGFDFTECMFITQEKDLELRKGKLQRGDVVLTTRGTLGNLAFYTENVPYDNIRINSGMVILRMNREIINETFFIEQFRMQVDDIKTSIASGSAQPQLPISIMNKIGIIIPNLSLQTQFASFVNQVNKSKVGDVIFKNRHTVFNTTMPKKPGRYFMFNHISAIVLLILLWTSCGSIPNMRDTLITKLFIMKKKYNGLRPSGQNREILPFSSIREQPKALLQDCVQN